ncbi:hypothetical protein BDZ90DRAFT_233220 [Jaminaea rosea]|uniref:Uncharacterized protein n=1 Tax=Jaminaea rosea TaxID=1569628 RepID=A0A316UQM9_9BASI|nr:hypothetical protein BDZ90DRAFT_233220 [Jaminaea rosea]PWN26611.1 hypothetical protein BDZ90DRAFT_233220 [Jaminaea rosea]
MVFLTFALTPFALALMALAPAYQAKHMVCTWKPGIGSPNQYKYEKASRRPRVPLSS